jgi:YidC/Oxa1 family membrane protein insertase
MDKKGIIAIAVSLVVLFAWTIFSSRESQRMAAQRQQQQAEAARKKAEDAAAAPPAIEAPAPAPAPPPPVVQPATPEQLSTVTTPSVEYAFTNLGGGVVRAGLRKHAAERGLRMYLNEFGSVPIGAVTLQPGEDLRAVSTVAVDETSATATAERALGEAWHLAKKFQLPRASDPEEYLFTLDLTFTNRSAASATLPGYFVHLGSAAPIHQADYPYYLGFTYHQAPKFVDSTWFGGGGFLGFGGGARPVYPDKPTPLTGVRWAGVTNQYFTTIVSPVVTAQDSTGQAHQLGSAVWARRFDVGDAAWEASGRSRDGVSGERHGVEAALGMPGFTVAAGQQHTQSFRFYAGPREYSRLKNLGSDEERVMDLGMFGWVSKILLNSMNWLNARLGSYAAAIIVLTIIIKLLLWPLQNKATNSMKRMSLLTPEMTKLREKYADDPQKMNAEIMKLYKDYGVNPVGGCLPMLVQIPIFFGFYNMLGKAVELRNSKFLWVQDLSMPDTIGHLLGFPINVLPLLMAATMLWTMAISPKSGDATQQRIMMFMPLIFIFFCYNFASALALYWTVQNLFSVVQLYATRNQAPPTLQKAAPPPKKKR